LGKSSDKGWSNRTLRKAVWAQGRALTATPQAMDLTKVATATPKRVKRLLVLLVFSKVRPKPVGDGCDQSGDSHTEAGKKRLVLCAFQSTCPTA
jgi:hypothetical protein